MSISEVEKACEQALQGGVCGVLVVRNADGSWLIGPHVRVPYGQKYEFPQGMSAQVRDEWSIPEQTPRWEQNR